MNPEEYTGKEWAELAKQLSVRQIRNGMKSAYRKEAKKAVEIGQRYLMTSGMVVRGNAGTWKKSVRSYIYSKGGGFLVTVKGRAKTRKNGKELSMHENRRFGKVITRGPAKGIRNERRMPIAMWAEDGTNPRKHRGWKLKGLKLSKMKGSGTGRMKAYGFLEKATPEMFRSVEAGLTPQIEASVMKQAAKAGFV